ncbi:MAG: type IV pilus assembly protein PilM [Thermoleophilia bacterium]|nr:type IV pilus assembly protein PilM [Thermoleophilia bacterium]
MSFLHPRNAIPDPGQSDGTTPSSAFDPSRTGDSQSPGRESSSIAYGATHVDAPAATGGSGRRPIGFAPPENDRPELRFSTELSFKRHEGSPRASVTPDQPAGDAPASWRTPQETTPDFVASDRVVSESGDRVRAAEENVLSSAHEAPVDEPVILEAPADDGVAEIQAEVGTPVEAEALFPALESEQAVATDLDEATGEVGDASDTDSLPFYRREISFRRKQAAPARVAETAPDASDASEPTGESPVASAPVEQPSPGSEAPLVPSAAGSGWTRDEQLGDIVLPGPSPIDAGTAVDGGVAGEPGNAVEDAPSEPSGPSGSSGLSRLRRPGREPRNTSRPSRRQKVRQVVGLEIDASQIAAAVVNETQTGHELVQLARRPLAPGIVVGGEVRDPDALALALSSFFDDEKLPRKSVRIGVSSNRIGVRTFDTVGIQDEVQFGNAVRFKAHELLPLAAQESVLDYRVLGERPNEEGEMVRRVLLVVAPRAHVEPYARVAATAGLKLKGIDLEALALLRTFVSPGPVAAGAVDDIATIVVEIGRESSTLLVAGGGACQFTRVFDWGGETLEEAIATSLEIDRMEAATILQHMSLSGPGLRLESLDDETRSRAVDAIRLRLTPFAREIVSSLQFYQTQAESLGIGGIVVTGAASGLEGLDAELRQMIGVDVEIGDPLARVTHSAAFDPAIEAVIGSMAVSIGLAVEDLATRGVNLTPGDVVKTRSRRSLSLSIAAPAAVAVPLVALGLLYLGAHGSASDSQAQLTAVAAEVASLPAPATPRIAANVVGDEVVRATAVASVLGGRVAWDAVFRDLSLVLPANVWLQTLSLSQPEQVGLAEGAVVPVPPGQPAAAPAAVNIDGFTYEQPDVARLLARLATVPSLARVTLVSSEQTVVGSKDVVHFVIVADLKNAGGAS